METSRRNFISGLALSFGSALTPLGALAFEAAMSPSKEKNGIKNSSTFSEHQLETLKQIVDIIIPTTDTPGAAGAGVHHFVDYMMSNFVSKEQQTLFVKGLTQLDSNADGFLKLSANERLSLLEKLDKNRFNDKFYLELKQLTVIGYYTSEIGAAQELNFSAVPGPYKEMPLSELGKAWS